MKNPITLAQEFASSMNTPVFIVDPEGNLLFYNEGAEKVLGRRFDQTGMMPASTWTRIFYPTDESGRPLLPEGLPLVTALSEHRPEFRTFWIQGIDNVRRLIGVAAVPITAADQRVVGAMALFWEVEKGEG